MGRKISKDSIIRYDYTNMTADVIGNKHGITEKQIEQVSALAERVHDRRTEERKSGMLPFMDLPYKKDEAREIASYADSVRDRYDNVVVLGIGGSALGTICLQSALNTSFHNLKDDRKRKTPRLFVEDNVDPERLADMLEVLDPERTLFNVISKSGTTAETMSAFLVARNYVKRKLGAASIKDHIIATTDREKGVLREIADSEGMKSFVVPDGVGGRFSVLTPVGLVPAALVGIDIVELLAGAAVMDKKCSSSKPGENPALMAAALQYLALTKKNKSIQVMMPYSNALRDVADWFRQLWAESLGKKYSLEGKVVNTGQTPVKAVGATDQHSQVQLYIEGPNDKTVTFIRVEDFRRDVKIPGGYSKIEALSYLKGHTVGGLMRAEQAATQIALTDSKRPNSTIIMPEISASTIGQLLYMLELQTSYMGLMLCIDTFDQPGVEAGKIATYALMGRSGFEQRAAEINKSRKATKRKVI